MIKDIEPWVKNGRWYHIRLISDGKKVTAEASDLSNVKFESNFIEVSELLCVNDYKIDFKPRNLKTEVEFRHAVIYKTSCTKIGLIPASAFSKMDVYIFGRREA